ncbi:TonB-dependent receptor [Tahibacter amnicola]|uniref:TonB-dependent receptor n=1 Tax=Tahibacter amnicola TaxID=2976241 RepID=A0ABY6B9U2_9GAMM|nr:TonB-dependent receptor [Tahibacter amnicola]UXI66301.1 TonB-dependent receptor [Tahibacter amnicola]
MIRRCILCSGVVVAASALAQSPTGTEETTDEAEREALLQLLAEETEVATRTRENADFVPGIVSVLTADQARALGARSVLDAIALLPGIEVNRDPNGYATLRVRGIDAFFNSGNVKVLVDGMDTSYTVAAQNSSAMLMPLALVNRIEVIRGPGSVVFGDFALNGLVNIVTHQDRNGAFAGFGAGGERLGGATLSAKGAWEWQLNVGRETSDRYDVPASTPADEDRTYADVRVVHGGLTIKAASIARNHQRLVPGQGANPATVRDVDEHIKAFDARYDWRFGNDNRVGVWTRYSDAHYAAAPAGFIGDRRQVGSDVNWQWGRHRFLAEVAAGTLDIDRANLPPAPPPPPNAPPMPTNRPARVSDSLTSHSVLVQDQFDANERLSLTAGLRYDVFSNVTSRVTPRLAAVWRAGSNDTLKAQYGEGFRTPVGVELYDSGQRNTRLDFETVHTSELAWIHRSHDSVYRATLYHQVVDDVLGPAGPPGAGFRNAGQVRSRGVELEANVRLTDHLRLNGNVSKIYTRRQVPSPANINPTPGRAFGTPEILANLGLIAQPNDQWTLGANWHRVGARSLSPASSARGYSALNLSAEHAFSRVPGLSLRLAVRNATDADITYVVNRAPPQTPLVLDYGYRIWSVELAWRR